MNSKRNPVLIFIFVAVCLTDCSQAGSIWAKRNKNMKALYADDVARRIGDILTIKVTENSTVDNKSKKKPTGQRHLMEK